MADDGYVPMISRVHWSWPLLLTLLTGGVVPLLMAIYFSWWIRKRTQQGVSIFLYGLETVVLLIVCLLPNALISLNKTEDIASVILLLWIATALVLRHEMRALYGKEFEINPFLTAIFSVFYLNYCLWAIGDASHNT